VSVHYSEEQQLLKYMLRNFRYTDLSPYNIENAFPKKTGQSDSFFYAHIGKLSITMILTLKHTFCAHFKAASTFSFCVGKTILSFVSN
jgi:hypothetical protein